MMALKRLMPCLRSSFGLVIFFAGRRGLEVELTIHPEARAISTSLRVLTWQQRVEIGAIKSANGPGTCPGRSFAVSEGGIKRGPYLGWHAASHGE
ncbi:hypothetical protein VTJ04DRAFT_8322 [Mycothermus thermophilus]|uniref:uncharacterized protein n=1 Tax=Humicola insolens TaxID=85995 RepID=UPI003743D8CB